MIVEELVGGLIPACFSWTIIEEVDGRSYLLPGDLPKICLLGEELSQKSVGVFIDAPLPRGIGMGKIGGGLKGAGNPFMLHKFGAIIKREGLHALLEGTKESDDGLAHHVGGPAQDSRADRIQ